MIRQPAVAGRFYPGTNDELVETVQKYLRPFTAATRVIGAVIPHAGYMYSGHVAGAVYSQISPPSQAIVLCPNHTGLGPELSIMATGFWQTPLGQVTVDEPLSRALMAAVPRLQDDVLAHKHEHAIEVQLPFLQHLVGSDFRFVPITVGTASWVLLEQLGNGMAEVVESMDPRPLIVASSDMNHYESDAITRVKDRKAIDRVLALDARGLYDVIQRERISMCGFGPTTSMLIAAKRLGASRADLIKYATSGEVSGDYDRVVGYAGMTVF